MFYFVWADIIILIWWFIPCMSQILGFWLCHGGGWQPSQTASPIHIRHIQSVWAHWFTVHGGTVSALHIYTHPTWLRFWGSWSLVESKWYDYVMVEFDSHLKMLPPSILTYTTCLSTLICCPLAYGSSLTQIPTLLGSDFGVLGHLWSQNDVIMSWLRLTATSNCSPHPY